MTTETTAFYIYYFSYKDKPIAVFTEDFDTYELIKGQKCFNNSNHDNLFFLSKAEGTLGNLLLSTPSFKFAFYDELLEEVIEKDFSQEEFEVSLYPVDMGEVELYTPQMYPAKPTISLSYRESDYFINKTGELYAIGYDTYGFFGLGNEMYEDVQTFTYVGSATRVTELLFKQVFSRALNTLALTTAGKLWQWGFKNLDGTAITHDFMNIVPGSSVLNGVLDGTSPDPSKRYARGSNSPADEWLTYAASITRAVRPFTSYDGETPTGWDDWVYIHVLLYYPHMLDMRDLNINGQDFLASEWGWGVESPSVAVITIRYDDIDGTLSYDYVDEMYGGGYSHYGNVKINGTLVSSMHANLFLDILPLYSLHYGRYQVEDKDTGWNTLVMPEELAAYWDNETASSLNGYSIYMAEHIHAISNYAPSTRTVTISSDVTDYKASHGAGSWIKLSVLKTCPSNYIIKYTGEGAGWEGLSPASNGDTFWGYDDKVYKYDNGWYEVTKPDPIEPAAIFSTQTFDKIAGSDIFWAGIKTDGSLCLWGDNTSGNLGNDSTTASEALVTIADMTFKEVSVASTAYVTGEDEVIKDRAITNANFTLAIDTDGHLWAWGDNHCGQLGLGNTTEKHTPQRVPLYVKFQKVYAGGFNKVTSNDFFDDTTEADLSAAQIKQYQLAETPHMYSYAIDEYGRLWGAGNLDLTSFKTITPALDDTLGIYIEGDDTPTFANYTTFKLLRAKGGGYAYTGWER